MPRVDLDLRVAIEKTPRVAQVSGLFDVPEMKEQTINFHFDVPIEDKDWQIGLIVGPSGAGKSSVARHIFKNEIVEGYDWHPSRSVVDGFGDMPVHEITTALNSVGFSSPPSWIKPFRVLSNGEQFRATLARSIVDPRPLVVLDEFTSVVDRTVARIGAQAVAKAIRRKAGKRFVAVTCHDDVLEWLQPDWVLEPHVGLFTWRSLRRRPRVDLQIHRADTQAWKFFSHHHYLSANLHRNSRCWVATIEGNPAAFIAVLPQPHPTAKHLRRVHRVVVLPDFQGLGIALQFMEKVGAWARALGYRLATHPAHPALVYAFAKSKLWKMNAAPKMASRHTDKAMRESSTSHLRRVGRFEYIGPKSDLLEARALWGDDTLNRTKEVA